MLLAAATRLQWPPELEKLHAALGENKISDSQWRNKVIQCFSKRYWLQLALLQWHQYSGSCLEKEQTLRISINEMSAAEMALKMVLGGARELKWNGNRFFIIIVGNITPPPRGHGTGVGSKKMAKGRKERQKGMKLEEEHRGEMRSWD